MRLTPAVAVVIPVVVTAAEAVVIATLVVDHTTRERE
jgi:hypothetical protein